ncbi:reverse transcriptase domain-containing protein [Tanacetum coccineum]|uniref:Reverse transcriptase domain-containing protein n=1 Tax=Tanacetum coccineum TaxID=301880 RepID=A0ABQ4XSG2_9ASTR
MPSHIKTYDRSEDPEDHLKIFQAAAKTKRWVMPTWCHMFNSTLIGNAKVWFDDLPPESIDSYDDLKKAFLENYLQQKKYIKDPIEIHNIKQQEGESTEDFVKRYKVESMDVKGASECMRISGFVQGITNPELIKRLHDKISKTVDKMIRVTTSFLRGEVAASNHERKKIFPPWKQHEGSQKQNFKKGGKFKAPPPMTTLVEKQNHAKFCEFHGEVGHNTDEYMHLKKQIKEMLKEGKLSHLIKELKQNNEKEQPKVVKKGETSRKDKANLVSTPGEDEGTEGPMIIEAEIGGHCVHREEHSASAWMNFMVVRSSSSYNGIIGRPGVRKLQAVLSTAHGMLKISVEGGVIILKSSKLVPLECAVVFGPEGAPSATKPIIEEIIKVSINPEYPEQTKMIGSTLTKEGRNKLYGLLQRNLDIFAWKPADMIGIPRHITEHRLNVREGSKETVSAVLMTKREAKQMPIYFVSKALRGPELNYTSMEKFVLALVHASKHLKRPRVSVKGQILADFIVEKPEGDSPDTLMEEEEELPEPWILFTDGSLCTDGSGAGLILINPEGMEFTYALRFRCESLQANVDSRLVAIQVNGTYVAKEAEMVGYLEKVKALTGGLKAFTIKQIPRSENKKADALSKIASTSFAHLSKQVLVEELKEKSISEVEVLTVVEEEGDTWMTPIYKYLVEETLPADMKKSRAIKRKSWRFAVINGILYKKYFLDP